MAVGGYIWQTPAMRANWEDFGDVVFLDMMKRQQNSVHWPYVSLALLDGQKKVRLAAEAIVIGESLDAYKECMAYAYRTYLHVRKTVGVRDAKALGLQNNRNCFTSYS